MRSRAAAGMVKRCPRCWVTLPWCVCELVPTLETRTRLLVLRHAKERWKTTNTARLAALALPSLRIVDYGLPDLPFDPALLATAGTYVLFPDAAAPEQPPPVRTVVVLDGTWAQARQMSHRVPGIAGLPRLSLPARTRVVEHLRTPPSPEGMATLEAIAAALELLEGPAIGEALFSLYDRYVEAVQAARGTGPRNPGRNVAERGI